MNDSDQQCEAQLRARRLPVLSDAAKRRLLDELANLGPVQRSTVGRPNATRGAATAIALAAATIVACLAAFVVVGRPATNQRESRLLAHSTSPPVAKSGGPERRENLANLSARRRSGPHRNLELVQRESLALMPGTRFHRKPNANLLLETSVQQQAARAEVIVVATGVRFTQVAAANGKPSEYVISWRVKRTLKGNLSEGEFESRLPSDPASIRKWYIGKDSILMLPPEFVAKQHPYAGLYHLKLEPRVKAILKGE